MPKKQRHWKSAAEIEKAIDKAYIKRDKLKAIAQTHYDAYELFRGCDDVAASRAAEEGDRIMDRVKRLENTRLNLLAAFNTQPLGEANGVEGLNCRDVVLESVK